MESKRRAELLTVRVRWAFIAAACVMLWGRAPVAAVAAIGGFMALYNLLVLRQASTPQAYVRQGRSCGNIARVLDLAVVTAVIAFPGGLHTSSYLLYGAVLVQAGYVDMQRRKLLLLGAASLVAFYVVAVLQEPRFALSVAALQSAAPIAAGFVAGLYIQESRKQDDAGRFHARRLNVLFECGMRFASGEELSRVLTHVLRSAVHEVGATSGYVMLLSRDDEGRLDCEVAYSKQPDYEFPRSCRLGEGLAGYVASTGQPLIVNSREDDGHEWQGDRTATQDSAICAPLLNRLAGNDPARGKTHDVIGCISVHSSADGHAFTEDDLDLIRVLGALISMAAANARMYEAMRGTFLHTLESLANSLEARDEYTRGHSQRVCDLSLMIARQMGVCDEALDEIRVGSILHDIGKIGIPDAILNKPGRLTEEEFALMRRHSEIGWEICRPLGLNEGALMLIRNHHEKLDGAGYPDRLRGGELPLSVRIVCVADAFDAMSSRRPYRDVVDEKLRLEQFNRFAGSQFDPVVVQVLKQLLREGKLDDMYRDHWADVQEYAYRAQAA